MTRAYVSAALRREVIERAGARCEYCRFPQDASLLAFEVEHIVAQPRSSIPARKIGMSTFASMVRSWCHERLSGG